jgi:hypothetical protein
VNQTETPQRFIWGFMRSGHAAREAPASGGASPYRAGINASSGGELRPRPSGCTTAAKHILNPGNHPIKRFALKGREPLHVGRVLFPCSFRRPFRALRQGMLVSQG